MSNLRTEIKDALRKERPLSESSLTTYSSLLHTLGKHLEVDKFEEMIKTPIAEIMKYVDGLKSMSAKKTLLSSLFILTKNETYQKRMIEYMNETNKQYRKQKVVDHRKGSYLTPTQLKDRFDLAESTLKKSPTPDNYIVYLICALMSGVKVPPRRLEWNAVKVKNFDTNVDNYLNIKKGVVTFNQYKTFKKYGVQEVQIPKDVMVNIRKWLKMNDGDYLLVTKTGKQMATSALSSKIGSIYGNPKIGVDILRSIYVSDIYKDLPALEHLEDTANAMGHSINSAMNFYAKKDINSVEK